MNASRSGNFDPPACTHDNNGNTLTDAQGRSFTWDFENRLLQATNPGVGTTTFKYDPFGRRVQKSGPNGTTNYLYDGRVPHLCATTPAGAPSFPGFGKGGDR